jgi:hypothetical protein
MAAIGSGINPALGRVDYSPFLQGAQMAAQGRMQGSNALTEGVSQGFQDYLKKREQNAVLEGRNASLVQAFTQDPTLKQFAPNQKALDGLMAKMAKGGGLTLNDNIKLNAELQTTVDMAEKAREANRQAENVKYVQAQTKALMDKAAEDKRVRDSMSATMAEIGKLGPGATLQQIINIGVANNMPLDNLRSLVGMNIDAAQFASNLKIADENLKRVENENLEAERKRKAFADTVKAFNGQTYRIIDAQDGTKVFERLNLIDGKMEAEVLKQGSPAAAIQQMIFRQDETAKIYAEYVGLINRGDMDSPENISMRDKLAERYNIINKDPAGLGVERGELDRKWAGGVINPDAAPKGAGGSSGKSSGIKNVSPAPAGAKPTAAAAPASTGPNLGLAAASTGFMGGAQPFGSPTRTSTQTPTQTPQQDTSIGAPVPPPAPNVVLPPRGVDLGSAAASTGFMGQAPAALLNSIPPRPRSEPSAIPFGMEPTGPSFRPIEDVGQEIDRTFEVGARVVGEAAKKVSRNFVNQVVPEIKRGAEVTLETAKRIVRVPARNLEQMVIPGLEAVGRDGIRLVKALANIEDYAPSKESISRLPSGKVMSISQILADPEAAGFGPSLAATALTTVKLDSKAQRIANELLEDYQRNQAGSRGAAPVPSLRASNASIGSEGDLYGMPKLRRGDAINQVSERPIAFRPQYSKAELEKSRKESRSLTDKMMRDQEQLRQLEQMMRSRRSRR